MSRQGPIKYASKPEISDHAWRNRNLSTKVVRLDGLVKAPLSSLMTISERTFDQAPSLILESKFLFLSMCNNPV